MTGDPAAFVHTARPIAGVEQVVQLALRRLGVMQARVPRRAPSVQQPALAQIGRSVQIVQVEHRLRLGDHRRLRFGLRLTRSAPECDRLRLAAARRLPAAPE